MAATSATLAAACAGFVAAAPSSEARSAIGACHCVAPLALCEKNTRPVLLLTAVTQPGGSAAGKGAALALRGRGDLATIAESEPLLPAPPVPSPPSAAASLETLKVRRRTAAAPPGA